MTIYILESLRTQSLSGHQARYLNCLSLVFKAWKDPGESLAFNPLWKLKKLGSHIRRECHWQQRWAHSPAGRAGRQANSTAFPSGLLYLRLASDRRRWFLLSSAKPSWEDPGGSLQRLAPQWFQTPLGWQDSSPQADLVLMNLCSFVLASLVLSLWKLTSLGTVFSVGSGFVCLFALTLSASLLCPHLLDSSCTLGFL